MEWIESIEFGFGWHGRVGWEWRVMAWKRRFIPSKTKTKARVFLVLFCFALLCSALLCFALLCSALL
ncbi:hypothetical protein EYC84_003834 [Monilinia fructicola]|uniref:Transmembrane protein n=1 Tax=Monilinia fructicola TaxID=38448 RepID=A0A5M9JYX4_MONFR|nr:hypothetical protein EYC84_003834 [Monilinia fructicola]